MATIPIPFGDNQSGKRFHKKSSLYKRTIVGISSVASLALILWPAPDQSFSITFIVRKLPFIMVLVLQCLSLLGYSLIPIPVISSLDPAFSSERKVSPLGAGLTTVLAIAGLGLLVTLLASFWYR